ncbi:Signal recognition particle receptor FtsY [Candidatus Erwinia haradaeae]|uniref:Signal recognition particle receptor FtsY n=1 Tax=Candidatus Erwinia haradaeae TaxID=1922217 RepID=A0A451DGF4_9GAMM|nr:Signal recognition particle receptor FtsY [Candidatus Erwinia haradaeae]
MLDHEYPHKKKSLTKIKFYNRLKFSLKQTRSYLVDGVMNLLRGKPIDSNLLTTLEDQLLMADLGVDTTHRVISILKTQIDNKKIHDTESFYCQLKANLSEILYKVEVPLDISGRLPFIILMIGVNGVGKTTTIGKLARKFRNEGRSVMLAAGDTFRAGAIEQLEVWGIRNNIPVIAQSTGSDPAAVIFDAIQSAKSRHIDVLIADTAGRLQNKAYLMAEIKKIIRVMKKLDCSAPHEVLLIIDASTGQNAISQTKFFHEAIGLTGIALTKLDTTAKGGVIFSIADKFNIPIRYISSGENLEDLRVFQVSSFIDAMFSQE